MKEKTYKQSEKKEIIIDRSKWRTGGWITKHNKNTTGCGDVALLNEEGNMCCLGFISRQQSKKSKEQYFNRAIPSELSFVVTGLSYRTKDGSVLDTDLSDAAMDINDNTKTTYKQKEKELIELFNKNKYSPYKLKFIGKANETGGN